MKTYIVYNCFLIKKWKELVSEQMERVKNTGLLDAIDKMYIHVTITGKEQKEEFNSIIKNYNNVSVCFHERNAYEYFGINRVWQLGTEEDCKIMYFHTKGVSNDYIHSAGVENNYSELKVKCIRDWRRILEYTCIDLWEENFRLLDENDMVGCSCNGNWWWGNFWWVHSRHVKKLKAPSDGVSRWDYEAWVNESGFAKIHEHQHMDYQPYFTDVPEEFYNKKFTNKYKGSKITIHSAYYGQNGIQIDEGRRMPSNECKKDVTDIMRKNLENNGGLYTNIYICNESMEGDPCYGTPKELYIKYSFECEPAKIFEAAGVEWKHLKFPFFNIQTTKI